MKTGNFEFVPYVRVTFLYGNTWVEFIYFRNKSLHSEKELQFFIFTLHLNKYSQSYLTAIFKMTDQYISPFFKRIIKLR